MSFSNIKFMLSLFLNNMFFNQHSQIYQHKSMKRILFVYMLICLSAVFGFSHYSLGSNDNNVEAVIDSIDRKEVLKENLKNDLTSEVSKYILGNSKHRDTLFVTKISKHIVNRALDNHIDICFILAQGHLETCFGSYGMGKSKKSIFGVQKTHNSYTECIDYYVYLLRKSYLVNKTEKQLMNNYVNKHGYRYAEDKQYEYKLKNFYSKVNKSTSISELQSKYINLSIEA